MQERYLEEVRLQLEGKQARGKEEKQREKEYSQRLAEEITERNKAEIRMRLEKDKENRRLLEDKKREAQDRVELKQREKAVENEKEMEDLRLQEEVINITSQNHLKRKKVSPAHPAARTANQEYPQTANRN